MHVFTDRSECYFTISLMFRVPIGFSSTETLWLHSFGRSRAAISYFGSSSSPNRQRCPRFRFSQCYRRNIVRSTNLRPRIFGRCRVRPAGIVTAALIVGRVAWLRKTRHWIAFSKRLAPT